MKAPLLLSCVSVLTVLYGTTVQVAPGPSTIPCLEGRYLDAYEVAAKVVRSQKGLPAHWRKIENYAVEFEGEKDGNYVMHFNPHFTGDVPMLDFSPKTGLPVRIYVQKKDLKFVKGVVE